MGQVRRVCASGNAPYGDPDAARNSVDQGQSFSTKIHPKSTKTAPLPIKLNKYSQLLTMRNLTGVVPNSSTHHGGLPHTRIETTRRKRDILTGIEGFSNKFVYTKGNPSLLAHYDIITNLKSTDTIESPYVPSGNALKIDSTASIYSVPKLTTKAIAAALSKSVFKKDGAVAFTVPNYEGTFVAFNDSRDGFQRQTDSVVYLKGFTISDVNFINIT
jgi:hypothetical protein